MIRKTVVNCSEPTVDHIAVNGGLDPTQPSLQVEQACVKGGNQMFAAQFISARSTENAGVCLACRGEQRSRWLEGRRTWQGCPEWSARRRWSPSGAWRNSLGTTRWIVCFRRRGEGGRASRSSCPTPRSEQPRNEAVPRLVYLSQFSGDLGVSDGPTPQGSIISNDPFIVHDLHRSGLPNVPEQRHLPTLNALDIARNGCRRLWRANKPRVQSCRARTSVFRIPRRTARSLIIRVTASRRRAGVVSCDRRQNDHWPWCWECRKPMEGIGSQEGPPQVTPVTATLTSAVPPEARACQCPRQSPVCFSTCVRATPAGVALRSATMEPRPRSIRLPRSHAAWLRAS